MVAVPNVVVCFLAALAHNIILVCIATSTVVVGMAVVFIYVVV